MRRLWQLSGSVHAKRRICTNLPAPRDFSCTRYQNPSFSQPLNIFPETKHYFLLRNSFLLFLICQSMFFILPFSALKIFQGFSLNFINQITRTLGRAVDKLLNRSKVNSRGQFIFRKKSLGLFRGNTTFHNVNSHIF